MDWSGYRNLQVSPLGSKLARPLDPDFLFLTILIVFSPSSTTAEPRDSSSSFVLVLTSKPRSQREGFQAGFWGSTDNFERTLPRTR